MIIFSCPGCRVVLKVPDPHAGKRGNCPKCGRPFQIPEWPRSKRRRIPVLLWAAVAGLLLAGLIGGAFALRGHRTREAALAVARETAPPSPAEKTSPSPPPDTPKPNPVKEEAPPKPQPPRPEPKSAPREKPEPKPVPQEKPEPKPAPPEKPKPAPPPARQDEKKPDDPGFVLYPVDGQEDVPLAFPGNEVPNPIPESKNPVAGYPVTVQFTRSQRVRSVTGRLQDGGGREVEVWFSSPEKPANPRHAGNQQNTVCLIPKAPLRPRMTYSVTVTAEVGGAAWARTWRFTTVNEEARTEELNRLALEQFNAYRRLLGLESLRLEPTYSRGCQAHARYLERNLARVHSLDWNDEKMDLAGASAEGREAARKSATKMGGSLREMTEWVAASFFNRHLLFNPGLRTVGLGNVPHPSGGRVWVIDLIRGINERAPTEAVLFPAPGQKNVPVAYPPHEVPQPVPERAGKVTPGFAISAWFPPWIPVSDETARLVDAEGREVECWLSTSVRPAVPRMKQYAIGLVPKARLAHAATYTVSMHARVDGRPWQRTWKFTTAADPEADQQSAEEEVLRQLNAFRKRAGLGPVALDPALSRGCLLHARYVARNFDRPEVRGLGVHDEDPKLPGYTPAGRRAGVASVITDQSEVRDAVPVWMSTLYHRIPLLRPDLRRVGFGLARMSNRHWLCVLDAGNGRERAVRP